MPKSVVRLVPLLVILLRFGFSPGPAMAQDLIDCGTSPPDAVLVLPPPLDRWGQIVCTPFGHVLTSHPDWIWNYPGGFVPAMFPSQMVDGDPEPVGNESYFTSIVIAQVDDAEYRHAYEVMHRGFAPDGTQPVGYRVDLTSVSGRTQRLYLLDYGDVGWGISCANGECDQKSSFMMFDISKPATQ